LLRDFDDAGVKRSCRRPKRLEPLLCALGAPATLSYRSICVHGVENDPVHRRVAEQLAVCELASIDLQERIGVKFAGGPVATSPCDVVPEEAGHGSPSVQFGAPKQGLHVEA
jgi:hypothetical protein